MEGIPGIPIDAPARIIRAASSLGGSVQTGPLELNLEDVKALADRIIRDAREKMASLDAESRKLEASLADRRDRLHREDAERKALFESELAGARDELRKEAEALRRESVERGLAEGRSEGISKGREEGYRAGFEEGYREGRDGGYREGREAERTRIQKEAEPLSRTLTSMIREIGARRSALLGSAREELLPLAMEIAKKVIKREVRECPEVVLQNIRKAIDLSFRRTALVIQVHPEDVALVEKHAPEVFGCFSGLTDVAVKSAEDVNRGGCRVVSSSGVVDMRLEAQLEIIEQALFRRLAEDGPEEVSSPAAAAESATPLQGSREEAHTEIEEARA